MTTIERLRFSDKLTRMSLKDITKMLDNACNKCVIRHAGDIPCDKRGCEFEKLVTEEIEFRKKMADLAK